MGSSYISENFQYLRIALWGREWERSALNQFGGLRTTTEVVE